MRIVSGNTTKYIYFVAVDATDFTTRKTGLSSFTVYRSRNGGAAAAYTTPTINETDATNMPGVYELLLDEDMTIDSGDQSQEVCLHITHAGMAPVTRVFELYRPSVTAGETLHVASSTLVASSIGASAITAAHIAANAITSSKLADGTITAAKFAASAIGAAQLAGSAITDAHIASAAITAAKFAASAITASVVAGDAITAAHIGASAIGAAELAGGAITSAHFAASAIGAAQIAGAAITDAHIAAAAITAAKFGASAITASVIAGSAIGAVQISASAYGEINAQVVDALATDTYAEPGQGAPGATVSLKDKIGYLYKAWRNRTTQTSSEYALYADDALTKDQKAVVSDDGTTFERGEVGTGA